MAGSVVNPVGVDGHSQHLLKKLRDTYCATVTFGDYACHTDRCHNTTTYIHDCDTFNGDNCDNFTTRLDICNSTGCRNTTRRVRACYTDVTDNCGTTDATFYSCTNGDCRNRTTHIRACYTYSMSIAAACAAAGYDVDVAVRPFFDAACVDILRRRRPSSSK